MEFHNYVQNNIIIEIDFFDCDYDSFIWSGKLILKERLFCFEMDSLIVKILRVSDFRGFS